MGGGESSLRATPHPSWPAQMRLVHYTAQPAPHEQLGSSPPMATLLGLPVPRTLCWWRPGQVALCAGAPLTLDGAGLSGPRSSPLPPH